MLSQTCQTRVMQLCEAAPQTASTAGTRGSTVARTERILLSGALSAKWKKLESILALEERAVVTRYSGDPVEILSLCARLTPCVLVIEATVIDRFKPREFSAAVNFGRTILVLAEEADPDGPRVEYLLRLGCAGVLPAAASIKDAAKALNVIQAGQLWASRTILSSLLRSTLLTPRQHLTTRETEILRLIDDGLKNHEIAERLFISPQTVRWHLRSLHTKLGTRDRSGLAARGATPEISVAVAP
jgi:DNA-binding NarL/FixJ family response regulator